ncbi:hypothetical protein E4582_01945 [Luteimonas yindakuii]|uniref:Lipoprotein n=1 Tax=Luteimonas yindakuii TaxID=2565782 RepID=A0A4Z1R540_9GAMM|nr:hypothetical protein [Luteimonas yindakuii]TKS53655.1 hypothetical protein E4582_01945 [Luteimonas yindakuii]
MKNVLCLMLLALLMSCDTGGFTDVTPSALVESASSWDGKFVRTCGYMVADGKRCNLNVCADGASPSSAASCQSVATIHLSSVACGQGQLPREGLAMVDGYFLALKEGSDAQDESPFVLRRALIQPVTEHCATGGT